MEVDVADGCLTEDDAVAYAHLPIDDALRAHVERHLDACDACRWLVSELARGEPAPHAIGRYVIGERLGSGGMGVVYAAYDPKLDRKIALKRVRPGGDDGGQARLLAEARAMARLSHPGVVPIYDVTSEGADVVLAMELVDGEDARRWLRRARPGWRAALSALVPAGRGLAAAHAAGIVHRDVKPANLLLGRDGRARITDFGLARATPSDPPDPPDPDGAAATSLDATRTGGLIGTPAYMAPEQLLGRSATPRSDQFSFCLVLYEAVYGERPFAPPSGAGLEPLIAAVTAGRVRPPPPGARVPAWLRRVIVRGLAVAPDDRWPSLTALLDALDHTPRRRRRLGLAAAALVALAGALIVARSAEDGACTGAPGELAQALSATDEAVARVRITALGPYGELAARELTPALDGFRARWIAGHRDACLAHQRGAQSDALLDLRMACLARRRAALAAAGDQLRRTTAQALADTVVAVRSLPDPAACGDVNALISPVAPPPPGLALAVAAGDAELARIDVVRSAGRGREARDQGLAVIAQARALGYRPLVARALAITGRAFLGLDHRELGAPVLAEAVSVAIEAGDDALAVEAWAREAYVLGTSDGGAGRALDGLPVMEAMARRLRAPSFAHALLDSNLGDVELAAGRRPQAAARFERALAEARGITGEHALELVSIRPGLAIASDDPDRREALLAEAEATLAHALGAEHPRTLRMRTRRALLRLGLDAARALLASTCASYERFHLAEAARVTSACWAELGFIAEELGDRGAAIAALGRAVELSRDGGESSAEPAGYVVLWHGAPRDAIAYFARAVTGAARAVGEPWWQTLERGELELGLGRARLAAGDGSGAVAALDHALADLSEVMLRSPNAGVHRRLARTHAARAQALRLTGAPAAQIAEAARAAAALLRAEGGQPRELAELARAGDHGGFADRP